MGVQNHNYLAEPLPESLAKLGQLGLNHSLAVALPWMARIVIMMLRLSRPEGLCPQQACDDRATQCFLDFSQDSERNFTLRFVLTKDGGSVLSADVSTLPVQAGGVMRGEEDLQYGGVADDLGVELHLHYFYMPGLTRANGLIIRMIDMPPGVARHYRFHTAHVSVDRFSAPETAASQHGNAI